MAFLGVFIHFQAFEDHFVRMLPREGAASNFYV